VLIKRRFVTMYETFLTKYYSKFQLWIPLIRYRILRHAWWRKHFRFRKRCWSWQWWREKNPIVAPFGNWTPVVQPVA